MVPSRLRSIAAISFAIAFLALPIRARLARADDPPADFAGFRIPTQDWLRWDASFSGLLSSTNLDQPFSTSRNRGGSGIGDFRIERGHDSDAIQHDLVLDLVSSGNGGFGRLRQLDPFGSGAEGSTSDDQRSSRQRWQMTGSVRAYPLDVPIGFESRLIATGNYSQDWTHHGMHEFAPLPPAFAVNSTQDSRSDGSSYQIDLTEAVGIGRVRDVSTVDQVWWFERRLRQDGTLVRPLSDATRARLAQLFSAGAGFGFAHERPAKAFWAEVEKLLREDGALASDRIAAYGLMHALDPLFGSRIAFTPRSRGQFVGPFVRGSYQHFLVHEMNSGSMQEFFADTLVASSASSSSTRLNQENIQLTGGLEAEWHRPYGVRWQVDLMGQAAVELRAIRRRSQIGASATTWYRIAERWFASAGVSQGREFSDFHGQRQSTWSVTEEVKASYFIEDHWSFDAGAVDRQLGGMFGLTSYQRSSSLTIGVSYGTGHFDAPGLIAPVRPLPVGSP